MVAHLPTAKECVDKAASAVKPAALIRLLDHLWSTNVNGNLFDPWRQANSDDLDEGSIAQRRFALAAHLSAPAPSLLLVGEAPGYRGCRVSGVPFTSEGLIDDGAIPRLTSMKRFSKRHTPWREASATHVWRALRKHGLEKAAILWNSVPWHPHPFGLPEKNRSPSSEEQIVGHKFLQLLLDALPGSIQIVAIGRVSQRALTQVGVDCHHVWHPAAHGGAKRFQEGIDDVALVLQKAARNR